MPQGNNFLDLHRGMHDAKVRVGSVCGPLAAADIQSLHQVRASEWICLTYLQCNQRGAQRQSNQAAHHRNHWYAFSRLRVAEPVYQDVSSIHWICRIDGCWGKLAKSKWRGARRCRAQILAEASLRSSQQHLVLLGHRLRHATHV